MTEFELAMTIDKYIKDENWRTKYNGTLIGISEPSLKDFAAWLKHRAGL